MDAAMTRPRMITATEAAPWSVTSFEEVYAAYRPALYRFACALADTPGDAEDLFQETWLKAVRAKQRPAPEELKAWLFTIAANLHRDTLRKRRVRRLFFLERGRTISAAGGDADPGWDAARFQRGDPAALTELQLCLRRALAGLPARQRKVFVLKDIEGFRHDEIGRMLGIPQATVRTLLHRAVGRLRKELAAFGPGSSRGPQEKERKL
jgi:RNA polymerase sigma-70 factor (ECF subfamily)